jgi:hypothetical protein
MDKVMDLTTTVQEVVKSYVTKSTGGRLYFAENPDVQLYTVIAIPDEKSYKAHIVVMARMENDMIIIETDNTDRYLYRLLIRAGVSREKIIRAHFGETVPLSQIPVD